MAKRADSPTLLDSLARIVGAEHLLTGDADLRFYGNDVHNRGNLPAAVVRPGSVEELQAVVRACHGSHTPLAVRGGGASYTRGYLHDQDGGVSICTTRLDRIVEVDEVNATVTVEAGVTWAALYEALKPLGLRTPFWGPFSGLAATVGGSMSQNAISHGTGAFGVSAESVLSFDIVTATGDLLRTGSAGGPRGIPHFRFYGPDLTGLFTGDCGALGVKARITLRLLKRREAFEALSFSFGNFAAMHGAMREVAVAHLDDENFGLDAALQQGQIGRQQGASAKAQIARSVLRSAGSLTAGVKQLARMAAAGDRALSAADYAVHYIVEGVDGTDARAKAEALRAIGGRHGTEIPNSVPTVVRSMPFAPLTNTLGPKGERWVPIHALLPHSEVLPFHETLGAYWDEVQLELEAHGIYHGAMFMSVGATAFVYEPAFYWPDEQSIYHERVVPSDHRAGLPRYPASEAARTLVDRVRSEVIDLMAMHGAAHLQIGRAYPYLRDGNPASVALLRAIKAELDPRGILNPGVLGL